MSVYYQAYRNLVFMIAFEEAIKQSMKNTLESVFCHAE